MRNRRLAISAAVVGSLGIALVPALAEAAQTSSFHHFADPSSSLSAFTKAAGVKQYHGSSVKTLVKARTGETTPNPTLNVDYNSGVISAYSVEFDVNPENLVSGSATVTADWGDGQTSSVQVDGSTTSDNPAPMVHKYDAFGTYTVTLTIDDGQGDTATATVKGVETWGSLYHAYGPTRILDTRKGLGEAKAAPVGSKGTLKLQVTGAGPAGNTIPAGITAVVMNVTVTGGTANGALSVFANEDAAGDAITSADVHTSNLNYGKNQNIPNLVQVPIGADGVADFYNNSTGSVGVIADVAGYFTSDNTGDKYVSLSPARILDTRKGIGSVKAKIPANHSITLNVDGSDNGLIPGSKVSAVALNLTAVDSTANGVITAYPAGENLPTVSNINYSTGAAVANMATVPVGTNGQIVLYNTGRQAVDLIADVAGYYTSDTSVAGASAYASFALPDRWFDSRSAEFDDTPIPAKLPLDLPLGFGIDGETAFVVNATAVAPTANGFLSLYSYDPANPDAAPTTSNLNYGKNQTVPNLAIVAPGPVDPYYGIPAVGLYLGGSGESHVIIDWFGMYTSN